MICIGKTIPTSEKKNSLFFYGRYLESLLRADQAPSKKPREEEVLPSVTLTETCGRIGYGFHGVLF